MTRIKLAPSHSLIISAGAAKALKASNQQPSEFVERYELGDWGEVSAQDFMANAEALECGSHVVARYPLANGQVLEVGTHGDRSAIVMQMENEF